MRLEKASRASLQMKCRSRFPFVMEYVVEYLRLSSLGRYFGFPGGVSTLVEG
jgi:hypothetical protein